MTARLVWLSLVLSSACGGDVPDAPTYFADVQPLLRANCARCHGADPSDPKIASFRLDRYVKDDPATFDVWDYAQAASGEAAPIVRVAVDHEAPQMPPDYELTDRQREILARWVEQGAPKGTRDNHAPQAVLVAPTEVATADQSIDVTVRAWDDDLDGLAVQLWAHDLATGAEADVPLGAPTGAGQRTLAVDTGALASRHDFEIYAVIDDGFSDTPDANRTRVSLIPRLPVDHGVRGTAPTVKLIAPNGGDTLIGETVITWTATDPDAGDALTIELALVRAGAEDVVVASIASLLTNPGSYAWTIPGSLPTTEGGTPIQYKIRVTATDTLGMPKNVRSDVSDASFTLEQATTTTYTWDDVKQIFLDNCVKCHGEPARQLSLEDFRLDKYDAADPEPPSNGDLGVYEMRTSVYQRMVSAKTMPPASEQAQPTADELAMVGNWILGGAPKGGGPVDPRPTFMWVAPTTTQTGATVTLQWTAADSTGLTSGIIQYIGRNGPPSLGCATAPTTGWITVADPKATATIGGAMTWNDSIAWTVPATAGYWCVRGSVTDSANQTTIVVNPNGIK